MNALEARLTEITLAYLFWEAIAFAFAMWLVYFAVKCAIRDGIRESGLLTTWATVRRTTRESNADRSRNGPDTLPDMRAD